MIAVGVGGALASKAANGGEAWVRLSYALGFRRLGCEVRLIEEAPGEPPEALAFAQQVADRFELEYADGGEGDLLVNISGNIRSRRSAAASGGARSSISTRASRSSGTSEGSSRSPSTTSTSRSRRTSAATGARSRRAGSNGGTTRPPVVLDEWPVGVGGFDRFTTVSTWRSPFGPSRAVRVEAPPVADVLWSAGHERGLAFEVGARHPPRGRDRPAALSENGWHLVDPERGGATRTRFRGYVQGSGAEFSVAQGIYVETGSGWFSDRTTRYLASGQAGARPGHRLQPSSLPVGEGLLAFRTLDEAAAGAAVDRGDYDRHAGPPRARRRGVLRLGRRRWPLARGRASA